MGKIQREVSGLQQTISRATAERLPMYLRYLRMLPCHPDDRISSSAIAGAMSMGEIQVRKDLAAIAAGGKPKVGYRIGELIDRLEESLGYRVRKSAVLMGAGRLGRALLGYGGFRNYGLEIVAAFDTDAARRGSTEEGKPILPVEALPDFCRQRSVRIGILTVPGEQAQQACDLMVQSGIRAIWNFAPAFLRAPDTVLIRQEDMALSLAYLSGRLTEQNRQQDSKEQSIKETD